MEAPEAPKGPPEHPHAHMLWHDSVGLPIVNQVVRAGQGVQQIEEAVSYLQDAASAGVDLEGSSLTLPLDALEKQLVALGLHLIGFFSLYLGALSVDVLAKLEAANEQAQAQQTPESLEAYRVFAEDYRDKREAALFGLSVDELRARRDAEAQFDHDFEDSGD